MGVPRGRRRTLRRGRRWRAPVPPAVRAPAPSAGAAAKGTPEGPGLQLEGLFDSFVNGARSLDDTRTIVEREKKRTREYPPSHLIYKKIPSSPSNITRECPHSLLMLQGNALLPFYCFVSDRSLHVAAGAQWRSCAMRCLCAHSKRPRGQERSRGCQWCARGDRLGGKDVCARAHAGTTTCRGERRPLLREGKAEIDLSVAELGLQFPRVQKHSPQAVRHHRAVETSERGQRARVNRCVEPSKTSASGPRHLRRCA